MKVVYSSRAPLPVVPATLVLTPADQRLEPSLPLSFASKDSKDSQDSRYSSDSSLILDHSVSPAKRKYTHPYPHPQPDTTTAPHLRQAHHRKKRSLLIPGTVDPRSTISCDAHILTIPALPLLLLSVLRSPSLRPGSTLLRPAFCLRRFA